MLLARCPSQSRYRFSEYAEDRKRSSGPPYPRPAQTPRPPGHLPPTTGVRERAGRPRSPRGLSYSISQRRSLLPARSREDQTCRRREQAGRKKKKSPPEQRAPNVCRGAGVGGEVVQATADPFLAPGSPGLRGLFGQKRKRGFSKVEEEPKKAGQTCKEQIPARCERPRSLERSQRILSKQQPPRINCVCARGGAPAPPSSWQP